MFAYLKEASGELAQNPERAVDVLINEVLESVEQQLIVVLDDYHHLGQETPVHSIGSITCVSARRVARGNDLP